MGIPKKSDEVVLRILQTLKKTKVIISPSQPPPEIESENTATIGEMNRQFENIEDALKKVNELLPNVKRWEEQLFNKFTDLEREIDGYSLENLEVSDEFIKKLQKVAENITNLETHISKLEVIHDGGSSLAQDNKILEIEYPTKNEDWVKLRLGDRVLKSREIRYLMASFQHLASPQSKMCALYYSIFPENWVLNKRQITYWWMAENWIVNKDGKCAAEFADDIFKDHLNQGLIKPFFKRKNSPTSKYFTIHPWIHRKLISIAKEGELFDFGPNGVPKDSNQRLFLFPSDEKYSAQVNNNNNNMGLISVMNMSRKYLSFKAWEVSQWKKVVALQLGRWRSSPKHHIEVESEDFLEGLKGQKFLKYLSLRGISLITRIPSSITKLVSLEILDIRACHNLEKLPDMSPLRNLTHLDLSECYLVENMPKGIEKLSKLQVLKGFVIGKRKSSSKVSDLVNLKFLRKLSIYIGSRDASEQQETELGMLKKIPSLRILSIIWALDSEIQSAVPSSSSSSSSSSTAVQSAASSLSLSLPERLQKLDLRCVPHKDFPKWLNPDKLMDLEKLYIRGGKLEKLTCHGTEKWNIKFLRFRYLKNLYADEAQLRNMFPSTLHLEMTKCAGAGIVKNYNGLIQSFSDS